MQKTRQMKHMSYKVRLTNQTIEEEVPPDRRQISKAEASLGTIEPATIARNPDISKQIVGCWLLIVNNIFLVCVSLSLSLIMLTV